MINLISDTVTKPSKAMLQSMFAAEVGDDVFKEDPTVNDLEKFAAEMFGHEAALYCPSGTMTNQIALQVHTQALDEVICDINSHIYQYETGGYAYNGRLAINTLEGKNGKLSAEQIEAAVKPTFDWLPASKLVVLENTVNRAGGTIYSKTEMEEIRKICNEHELILHLDGARLFNALVETGDTPLEIGSIFHSISICLSKGLGAPVGSLLIGSKMDIIKARRFRKVMGGGMRQAGFMAAAGLFALKNNVARLKIDNDRAKKIAKILSSLGFVENIRPVQTNIIIFDIKNMTAEEFKTRLKDKGINCSGFGPQTIRFVLHLDISSEDMITIEKILSSFEKSN